MLFSEPKIPQSERVALGGEGDWCFSALQRAENSSMFPLRALKAVYERFSALQRAENSSIRRRCAYQSRRTAFQCSSASRKFLNGAGAAAARAGGSFQCSSASRKFLNLAGTNADRPHRKVSVLFSEPKIPQLFAIWFNALLAALVSVLFSEPKIPQSREAVAAGLDVRSFSALQRAENSSISSSTADAATCAASVSVLFSEPKIPQLTRRWNASTTF